MEVKLLQITENPIQIMYTAARTCYSSESPVSMYEKEYDIEKMKKLVKTVLDSGHQSIAEHIYMTFAIEGISRACSHQLVRHRAGIVFSQQSQRYVEIKEGKQDLYDVLDRYEGPELQALADKYFVTKNMVDVVMCIKNLLNYRDLIDDDFRKPEDARAILPNATKTNIVMSINLRELIHVCNLRLCTRAQKEIRDLFNQIKEVVMNKNEFLGSFLVPECEISGFCKEHKCCGRKPTLKEIMNVYTACKEDTISEEDKAIILKSIDNATVNKKLEKILNMKSIFEGEINE